MGQYHLPVNLDKREFIHPHRMGDGLKLMEQVLSGAGGTGSALLLLLAASNGDGGRGGGDYREEDPEGIVGRWAGDRIALVGDYAEDEDLPAMFQASIIYSMCDDEVPDGYTDITGMITRALQNDGCVKYREGSYGGRERVLWGEEGFDEEANGAGTYQVCVVPPLEGPYEGATEFVWNVNHKQHAINKATKRGLVITAIDRIEG